MTLLWPASALLYLLKRIGSFGMGLLVSYFYPSKRQSRPKLIIESLSRIHFSYFLSNEAELRRAFRIDILFVVKGDRPQRITTTVGRVPPAVKGGSVRLDR